MTEEFTVTNHINMDDFSWNKAKEDLRSLQKLIEESKREELSNDLAKDFFLNIVKKEPTLTDEVPPSRLQQEAIVKIIRDGDKLKGIRQKTIGDPLLSTKATEELIRHFMKQLEEGQLKDIQEKEDELEKLEGELEELCDEADQGEPNEEEEEGEPGEEGEEEQEGNSEGEESEEEEEGEGEGEGGSEGQGEDGEGEGEEEGTEGEEEGTNGGQGGEPGEPNNEPGEPGEGGEPGDNQTPNEPTEGEGTEGETQPEPSNPSEPGKKGGDGLTDQQRKDLSDLMDKIEEKQGELEKEIEEATGAFKDVIDRGINDTEEEIQDLKEAMAGWGLTSDTLNEKGDFERRLKLLEQIKDNPEIKEISQLLGRLKRIFKQKKKESSKQASHEIVGVEYGDNIFNALASEFVYYSHKPTRKLTLKKIVDKELLTYKKGGKEKEGKGPIVVCLDESASMAGNAILWGKAVALALAQISKQENRRFMIISFGGPGVYKIYDEEFFKDFMTGAAEFSNNFMYAGGTDLMTPLNFARDFIIENRDFKDADICMITDGVVGMGNQWIETFKESMYEFHFQLRTIVIEGKYGSGSNEYKAQLEDLSTDYHTVNDIIKEMKETNAMGQVFGALV